jgi:acid phosphatase
MMSVAVDARPAFVINTGDLTDHGNSDVEWNEQFFAPAAPLLASVPIVPVFGNHDHQDESWYSWFALPGNEAWFSFTAGDAELFALDNYTGLGSRSEQGAWLEGALAASTARWKIVIMHQPLRSCLGDRERRRAAQRLRELLEPTFVEHHVRLVLAGHDHVYGRSKEEQGLTLVTTGGGGAGLYPVRQSDDHAVCASEWNFVLVDVSAASLRVRAFRPDGELLDEFEILQEQETTAEHR